MGKWAVFLAGVLFGAGVTVSGMVNPAKVLNFMDIAGRWDPTLILVMSAALVVTFIGYRFVLSREGPLFAVAFMLPKASRPDRRLVLGAVLFGIGWGLTGFCPGPAVASLIFGRAESFIFVIAMAVGMIGVSSFMQHKPFLPETPSGRP